MSVLLPPGAVASRLVSATGGEARRRGPGGAPCGRQAAALLRGCGRPPPGLCDGRSGTGTRSRCRRRRGRPPAWFPRRAGGHNFQSSPLPRRARRVGSCDGRRGAIPKVPRGRRCSPPRLVHKTGGRALQHTFHRAQPAHPLGFRDGRAGILPAALEAAACSAWCLRRAEGRVI
ncbi:unnamed protein product [Prorocentrum cordatum]|uniref:Uncharacterized protein n=1 Tax=Prorocentrum cordatum TaxID=2364126 RepID=A0ABN9SQH6_9DINO|nr:unnamed protein product [Polarella glacialis]